MFYLVECDYHHVINYFFPLENLFAMQQVFFGELNWREQYCLFMISICKIGYISFDRSGQCSWKAYCLTQIIYKQALVAVISKEPKMYDYLSLFNFPFTKRKYDQVIKHPTTYFQELSLFVLGDIYTGRLTLSMFLLYNSAISSSPKSTVSHSMALVNILVHQSRCARRW